MKQVFDLLKDVNYFIKYSFDSSAIMATIEVSWTKETFNFTWGGDVFLSNFGNTQTQVCPNYAAPSLAWILLQQICKKYDYPVKYVCFELDKNPIKNFQFIIPNISPSEHSKVIDMRYITDEYLRTGISADSFAFVQANNMVSGLSTICESMHGIKLGV